MDHTKWTARDGAPQGVRDLAQGADGTLWIGSEGGLFNFDGRAFNVFQPPPDEPELPPGRVETILAAADHAIWVGFRFGGLARISQGHVKLFTQADRLRLVSMDRVVQSANGGVWALHRQQNLIRYGADGTWHVEPSPLGDAGGRIRDIFIDSADTLWLAQGGRLYRRPLNQSRYFATDAQADWLFGFAEAPDHSVWVTDSITDVPENPIGRTQRVNQLGKVLDRLPYTENVNRTLYGTDDSIIMATNGVGVVKIPAVSSPGNAQRRKNPIDDTYQEKNGLSSDSLRALLLDADGNIWTGGQRGLDRFRRALLVPLMTKYGVRDDSYLCAASNGVLWLSAMGSIAQLYEISGGTRKLFRPTGQIYSISCGSDGDAWLLANNGIYNVHSDQFTRIPTIPGTSPFAAHQIVAMPDHTLFVTVAGSPDVNGIWRYVRGKWSRIAGADTPSPFTEYLDVQGRLWAGYRDGTVRLPLEGGRVFSSGNPGLGTVFALLETSHGLLAAGLNGIAVRRADGFQMLDLVDRVSTRGVGGLVESNDGDVWLNTLQGVVCVPSSELGSALNNPHYAMRSTLFTEGDFVGPVELSSGKPTAARDDAGNLWFATLNGVFHIDPRHMHPSSHLPVLSINSISADRMPVSGSGSISPGSQTLDIHYLGVNLTTPDNVTYQYRLDGLDDAWQEVGHRTEAIYTRLRPGQYTFRVMASNGDGVWTKSVSSASFQVLPHFYETLWFYVLCATVLLALIGLLYRLRLRQLQKRHDELNRSRLELTHVTRLATLSMMTASITHEISQPISGILTNCSTGARMLATDPANVLGAAETIRRSIRDANRASEIIKRLRAMFANRAPTMEMVNLNDAAREVIAMSSAEIRQSGSVLQTELADALPAISGDRVQLQQVILNLLLNAADAMAGVEDRPRTLRLRTEIQSNNRVKLLVRDSGVGLDAHSIDRVFEAFYTTKAHGLGIGLAVSRSIIESHKGQLWATANDGPGATFCLSIPFASGAAIGSIVATS